jgi:hypothetical protein
MIEDALGKMNSMTGCLQHPWIGFFNSTRVPAMEPTTLRREMKWGKEMKRGRGLFMVLGPSRYS